MQMKWLIRIKIAIVSLYLFVGCEKDVVLDLADQQGQFIVIEANIDDTDSLQFVRVTRTSSYYDTTQPPPVTNANVSISGEQGTYIFEHSTIDSLAGYYFNDQINEVLQPGDYTLSVEVDNQQFTAVSTYKPVIEIDSITFEMSIFSQLGFTEVDNYNLIIHFQELPTDGDFYMFNFYSRDTLRTRSPNNRTVTDDESFEDYVSISIESFSVDVVEPGDEVGIQVKSISEENFDFHNVFFTQTDLSGNPFAGAPPANIPTNISNGAKGFFQVSAESSLFVPFQIPPPEEE